VRRHLVQSIPCPCPESRLWPDSWQLFRNLLKLQPDTTLGRIFAIEGPLGGVRPGGIMKWDLNVGGPISTDYLGVRLRTKPASPKRCRQKEACWPGLLGLPKRVLARTRRCLGGWSESWLLLYARVCV
jgi:hypothetical protein